MLYMAQPTFPFSVLARDELLQPVQTATPSSIPSDTQAALCDITRSRWRIRIDLVQRTRGVATRGPSDRRPRVALQVDVGSDVTAAGWRGGGAVGGTRGVTSRENSTGRGLARRPHAGDQAAPATSA